jgi:hypothetical protein
VSIIKEYKHIINIKIHPVKEDGRYVIINQEGRTIPLKAAASEQKKYIVKSELMIASDVK